MADRWAVATGNWSNTATWNGGSLPGTTDDVYADGFTVTIDQSVTVASIRNTQRSGGTAGGGFTCSTGGLTITANLVIGTTTLLTFGNNSGNVAVAGNVTGSQTTASTGLVVNGAGSKSIVGSITGGAVGNASAIDHRNGSLTVTGSVTGGSATGALGIQVQGAVLDVTGAVAGGSNATAYGIRSISSGTVTITGDCTGATAAAVSDNGTTSTTTINGNVIGASASLSGVGVLNSGTGTVAVNGNAIAGTSTSSTAYGAHNSSTGTMTISGYAIGAASGGLSPGVFGAISSTTSVAEVRYSSTGVAGAGGKIFFSNLSTARILVLNSSLQTKYLYPTDYAGLLPATSAVLSGTTYNLGNSSGTVVQPATSNVVLGVTYGPSSSLTGTYSVQTPSAGDLRAGTVVAGVMGTLAVPSPSTVAVGVPTDDTVGTAFLVNHASNDITLYTGSTRTVSLSATDADGAAIDLDDLPLELVIESRNGTDAVVIADADIGRSNGTFTFTIPSSVTTSESIWKWSLTETETDTPVAFGTVYVNYVARRDS